MNRIRMVIEPLAKADIRAARDYYSSKSNLTTEHFRDDLTRVMDFLARHPEAVAIAFGRTRLKPMRYFPYVVGYIFVNDTVHVTGVQFGGIGWTEFERRQF